MSCWFFLDFICIDWCWVYLEEVCICFITYQDLLIYFVVIVVLLFIYLFLSMLVGLWELNSPSGYCIQCSLQWKLGVLTTGQPGNFPSNFLISVTGSSICQKRFLVLAWFSGKMKRNKILTSSLMHGTGPGSVSVDLMKQGNRKDLWGIRKQNP